MHTLVSASALGFDLVRLPGGARAAEVLLRSLAAVPDDLPVLAMAYAERRERDLAWLELTGAGAAAPSFGAAAEEVRRFQAGHADAGEFAVRLLERVMLGTLDGLLTCVRHDVFDWTWRTAPGSEVAVQDDVARRAVAVVCDAVAAGWGEHLLPPATRRILVGGWLRAHRNLPARRPSYGPQHDAVVALLVALRQLSAPGRTALAAAGDDLPGQWSQAVHDATWAAHLSGRLRPAAAAQLATVTSLRTAGLTAREAASGAWNAASGAVQALVVADLVGTDLLEQLLAPARRVLGTAVPTAF